MSNSSVAESSPLVPQQTCMRLSACNSGGTTCLKLLV